MKQYVDFLNAVSSDGRLDLDIAENFWVAQVRLFFAGKPFRITSDSKSGIRSLVRNLVDQAIDRQQESPGTWYAGTLIQHLVGAKLELVIADSKVARHSASTADNQTGRSGDFVVGDTAIHVSTAPRDALVKRCLVNLASGVRPIIVTLPSQVHIAEVLAEDNGAGDRIDIFDIEQFLALNIYELSGFEGSRRKAEVSQIVSRYNDIIDAVETDPSLRIEID